MNPSINIRATFDQYLAPNTSLSFEEAIALTKKTLDVTPLDTVNQLKEIVKEYPRHDR